MELNRWSHSLHCGECETMCSAPRSSQPFSIETRHEQRAHENVLSEEKCPNVSGV